MDKKDLDLSAVITTKDVVKDLEDAAKYINIVTSKLYEREKKEDEPDLYYELIKRISNLNPDSVDRFISLVKLIEPEIENKNSLVQQYLISLALIRYLYTLKGLYSNVKISSLLISIPYHTDNHDAWLKVLTEYTIPTMINNKIL